MDCSLSGFPSITNSPSLLKLKFIKSAMAIQTSHPLLSPSPALHLSQHQGLFQWVSSPHASGGQSTGASALASVLPMNIQDWFPLGCTGLISLQSLQSQKHQFFGAQLSLWSNSHPYMTTGKTTALTKQTFVGKVMSLLLNMLFKFVIAFLNMLSRFVIAFSSLWLIHKINQREYLDDKSKQQWPKNT